MRGRHMVQSPDYYEIVESLLSASPNLFKDEKQRQNWLKTFLGRVLGRPLTVSVLEDGTSNDGVCVAHVKADQNALLLLCEMKNEIGSGECDPSVQAGFAYSRWWSQTEVRFACSLFHLSTNTVDRRI